MVVLEEEYGLLPGIVSYYYIYIFKLELFLLIIVAGLLRPYHEQNACRLSFLIRALFAIQILRSITTRVDTTSPITSW